MRCRKPAITFRLTRAYSISGNKEKEEGGLVNGSEFDSSEKLQISQSEVELPCSKVPTNILDLSPPLSNITPNLS